MEIQSPQALLMVQTAFENAALLGICSNNRPQDLKSEGERQIRVSTPHHTVLHTRAFETHLRNYLELAGAQIPHRRSKLYRHFTT